MTEALSGLAAYASQPGLIGALLLAVPYGMMVGAVPGLGGKLSIVMALPFLIGLDPIFAAVFLIATHSVIHTGGPIPSILIGIPGTGPDAATVVDGYPMTKNGEAARALGAALMASCVGGLFGALCLAASLPLTQRMLHAFGPPEIFLLAILGISLIASTGSVAPRKGLMVGCLGLLVSFVGMDPISGVARFTFGQLFLWDGVDLISAVIGLFAIPEMLALQAKERPPVGSAREACGYAGLVQGMRDVWLHRFLTLRASLIGTLIGLVPGLGGEVASWLAYGHAVQSSPRPEEFGTGRVEGVIAPECANNSKEGGSLLPTLFFGVPGSSGMAILLGALLTLGITPGAWMANEGLPLVWTFIWALVFANLLSVIVFLAGSRWILRFVDIPGPNVFPFVLSLALLGSFLSALHWETLLLVFGFGCLGYAFKRQGWPRAPFAIGLVLGKAAEIALHQSLTIWGPGFLLRPMSLVLLALVAVSLVFNIRRRYLHTVPVEAPQLGLTGLMLSIFAAALFAAATFTSQAALFPLGVAGVGLFIGLLDLARSRQAPVPTAATRQPLTISPAITWLFAFVSGAVLFGLTPGLPVLTALYMFRQARAEWFAGVAAGVILYTLFEGLLAWGLGMNIFHGLVMAYVFS